MKSGLGLICRMELVAVAICFGLACGNMIGAQTAPVAVQFERTPMGWSSWNSFSNTVDAQIVMKEARAMVPSGMKAAGYEYVNIDAGWWNGTRDSEGNIEVDPKAWPALATGEHAGDMANIVRFIHSLGLKAGIYTDAGKDGCSMFPDLGQRYFHTGSEGHYDQDFLQFARWGFDYVKVDWCGGNKENLDPAVQYAEIADAIARAEVITDRRLYFSICEWGKNSPWTWAPNVGGSPADIWRTSGDIAAPIVAGRKHAGRNASFAKVLSNFDQGIHPEAEHTGYYNDPDMMVLGMPGLSDEQNRLHMALWAISGAPLIVGADITKLNRAALADLTNPRVVAMDQDPAGLQAVKVSETEPGLQVWSKALIESGRRAVLLLNRTASDQVIVMKWTDLGLTKVAPRVINAWTGKELQSGDGEFHATVSAENGLLLLVSGSEMSMRRYKPTGSDRTRVSPGAALWHHPVRFVNIKARMPMARIQIVYSNPDSMPRYAELEVNGQDRTRIAFPPTGSKWEYIWIQSALKASNYENKLEFSGKCELGPVIHYLAVQ